MVLPTAVDAEIIAGAAFFPEAELEQKPPARLVVGQAGGFDAMQAQFAEAIRDDATERLAHIAAMGMGGPDPIAEARGLGDTAADLAQRDAAEPDIVLAPRDQEAVALVGAPFLAG